MQLLSFILFLFAAFISHDTVTDAEFSSTGNTINYSPKSLHKNLEKLTSCPVWEKEEIDVQRAGSHTISGKFFRIICNESTAGYLYIGRVKSCRAGGCNVGNLSDEYEFFDYFTIYDTALNVVNVNVYNYEATHGHEITIRGWLKQFIGYSANKPPLVVDKDIDAISGATISVNGITDDIVDKAALLKEIVNIKD